MRQKVYYYEDDKLKIKESTSRYFFSTRFVKNKLVIDIGCGARKGPSIISEFAFKVIGVDIIQEAVFYCTKKWFQNNILYLTADARRLPFKEDFFDCVLSFELIEHIDNYKDYLAEVNRILKFGGIMIISTPNRFVTSPTGIFSNPDHVREFDLKEFKNILSRYFSKITLFGQFPSKRVRQIEDLRRENYQHISKMPRILKKILPDKWKEFFSKKYLYYYAKFFKNLDEEEINEKDFLITTKNVERAKHFLAICKK